VTVRWRCVETAALVPLSSACSAEATTYLPQLRAAPPVYAANELSDRDGDHIA
jgi:hypothetical protein